MAAQCALSPDKSSIAELLIPTLSIEDATSEFDRRFIGSCMAFDTICFTCGRMSAPFGGENDCLAARILCNLETHRHPNGEVALTTSAANEIASLLKDVAVGIHSSAEYSWRPLSLPILVGEEPLLPEGHIVEGQGAFGAPSPQSRALHNALAGALHPGLTMTAWGLEALLEDLDGMMHPTGRQDWLNAELLLAFKARGLGNVTVFVCRPQYDVDRAGLVVPHAIVGTTQRGSLAGVLGLTEWC